MNQVPNLLIVDDVKINIVLLEIITRKITVNIIKAYSGREALEKSKGIDLALAIIDVRMPVMGGYELAIKLNDDRVFNKVPIIFMTAGYANENELKEGYRSGAVDYLLKPVEPSILFSKISVFLEIHKYKRTIQHEAIQLGIYADELTRVNLALKVGEEKYRSYIDNAPDGVFVTDEEGRFHDVNNSASRITGYLRDELLTMSMSDLLSEDSYEDAMASFRSLKEVGAEKAELLIIHKCQKKRWLSVDAVRVGESRYLGFTKDITARKELEYVLSEQQRKLGMQNDELIIAEDQAKEALRKYSELYDSAPLGYFTLSVENKILELNYSGARMLGKKRSDLLGCDFGRFISESSTPAFSNFSRSIFESNGKKVCELLLEAEGGHQNYVHAEGMVVIKGKHCQINLADITERKLAEQTLKVSEEKYRTMLNASPDGILLLNLYGVITESSDIALELFGTNRREDIVGNNINMFVPGDEIDNLKDIFERTMSEGLVQNIGLKIRKKNKTILPAEVSVTLIQGPDLSPLSFMVIIRDISQRTKMEAAQIHAARMASLGEMATGIAHEINQPLNIISMVMDKILFESSKEETIDIEFIKGKSDKIFDNITRIRNIIDHIRAFSRSHDDYIATAFNVNLSIENASSMIAEQFKYLGIELEIILDKSIPLISGNTYKFEQVMINLLNNAKDAVIEKKNSRNDSYEMLIKVKSFQEDNFIVVEVIDNGIGINSQDISSIMLPFYTTKEEGKGTGLGLAICYQILKEMDGSIEVESERQVGTSVKLLLNGQK